MELAIHRESEIAVMTVHGRLTVDNVEEFRQFFAPRIEGKCRMILDLSGMEYIDSTGLGALVALLQKVSDCGGKMAIAALQAKPKVVFDITRAVKVFNIFPTVQEASAFLAN